MTYNQHGQRLYERQEGLTVLIHSLDPGKIFDQHEFAEGEYYLFVCKDMAGLKKLNVIWAKIVNERRLVNYTSSITAGLMIDEPSEGQCDFRCAALQLCRMFGWRFLYSWDGRTMEEALYCLELDREVSFWNRVRRRIRCCVLRKQRLSHSRPTWNSKT